MTSYDEVTAAIENRPADVATVIAVCNVHSVMTARSNGQVAEALGSAEIATSDGVPLVWAIRWTARPDQQRVYGPELMRRVVGGSIDSGLTHFFYGSTPETLDALSDSFAKIAPGAVIAGTYSPPFRDMTDEEHRLVMESIRASGADVVWVGLGMPKQELWMHSVRSELPGVALVGVGAAFDFIAGTKKEAPHWIQRAGLEWLFRLGQEPRRLWRRYLFNNPMFVLLLARQIVRIRFGSSSPSA
jgi:N-acetylglucosaminyldiphosphoundecaprenol N-acetyl-beta-D-mannosaminyltransferase